MSNASKEVTPTAANIEMIREHIEDLEIQAAKLRAAYGLARGTQELRGPYWTGDEGPTADLVEAVTRAISDKPRTLRELVGLTGARRNRVSACFTYLAIAGRRAQNLGTGRKAVWFLGKPGQELPSAKNDDVITERHEKVSAVGNPGANHKAATNSGVPSWEIVSEDSGAIIARGSKR